MGRDEVGDGFGFGQVELAVEERALGEFTRGGLGTAGVDEGAEDGLLDVTATVAGDLDGVFAGERMRGAEDATEDLVQERVWRPRKMRSVRAMASGPLTRRTAMPPVPGAVDMAQTVFI